MQTIPVSFQANDSLPKSGYLPGLAVWTIPVRLIGAAVLFPQGFTGTLTLSLEVNGVLTGDTAAILGTGLPGTAAAALNVTVPANQTVRWQCAYDGDYTQAPQQVQLQLSWSPVTRTVTPVMELAWQNGSERMTLFSYDPATQVFTDVSDGLSVGRAFLDTSNGWSLYVQGDEIMRIRNGTLYAATITEGAWPDLSGPLVRFMVNGVAWLTVSNSGIYGGCWTETTDLPATTPRFQLGDSVVLSVDGLFALNLVEGIPS